MDEIDRAVNVLLSRFRANMQAIEAMQFSQAVYNLSNAKAHLAGIENEAEQFRPKRGRPPKVSADEA